MREGSMSRASTVGGLLLFVAIGLVLSLYGPAIPELREAFGVGAGASGLVLSAHFAGAMAGIASWALLERRLGAAAWLRAATALLVAGAAGLALAPVWAVALAAAALVGVGFGVLVVALNTLFASGFGHRSAAMLNLLGASFGVGAVLGPLAFAASGGFRIPFLAGAALATITLPLVRDLPPAAGLPREPGYNQQTTTPPAPDIQPGAVDSREPTAPSSATLPLGGPRTGRSGSRASGGPRTRRSGSRAGGVRSWRSGSRGAREPRGVRAGPGLVGGFVVLYVSYVGVESTVGGWEATSLLAHGTGEAAAANWTAGYWAAITAGRLLAIPVALRVAPPRLVTGALLLAVAALALAHGPALAPFAYTLTGLALAPVFPTGLAWLAAAAPGARASTALVVAGAQLGGVLVPAGIGRLIDAGSPAVIPTAGLAVAVACLATALVLRRATSATTAASL
jgi:FHS family glucose/mannose:H+ symporter-like MFS transporter